MSEPRPERLFEREAEEADASPCLIASQAIAAFAHPSGGKSFESGRRDSHEDEGRGGEQGAVYQDSGDHRERGEWDRIRTMGR